MLAAAPPMVVVDERQVMRREPAPHGEIGVHPIAHDEVYYALSGQGEVESDGVKRPIGPGMAAYFYKGAQVGIRQLGKQPPALIVSYPVVKE